MEVAGIRRELQSGRWLSFWLQSQSRCKNQKPYSNAAAKRMEGTPYRSSASTAIWKRPTFSEYLRTPSMACNSAQVETQVAIPSAEIHGRAAMAGARARAGDAAPEGTPTCSRLVEQSDTQNALNNATTLSGKHWLHYGNGAGMRQQPP